MRRGDKVAKELRNKLALSKEQASDKNILEGSKNTLLLAGVELKVAWQSFKKGVLKWQ